VMINSEDGAARRAVAFHVVDYYLGIPDQHWNEKLKTVLDGMIASGEKAMKAAPEQMHPNGTSTLPIPQYAGLYRDPWYGTATISLKPDHSLWIRFDRTPGMEGPLQHVADDTFRAAWTDRSIEKAYVKFDVASRKIEKLEMRPASPLADFSFDYRDLHFTPAGHTVAD